MLLESVGSTLISGRSETAVSLGAIREHVRVDGADENDYLHELTCAAERYIEDVTGRALQTQEWREAFAAFPGSEGGFRLARRPVVSVASLTYYEADDTATVLGSATYQVDTYQGRIVLRRDYSWPTATLRRSSPVVVQYTAGALAPPDLVHAVKLLVAHMFEYREPEVTATVVARYRFAVDSLILPYRVGWF